jgi:hypothetical protein
MSDFVRQYIAASAFQQTIPVEIIADHGEIPIATEPALQYSIPRIQIQIEDFVGSFPLPCTASSVHRLITSTPTC